MTLKLKISAKNLDTQVNYIPFSCDGNFTNPKRREVPNKAPLPLKVVALSSTLGVIATPSVSFAQSNTQGSLDPQMIMNWSMETAMIGLGASVGITSLLLMVASVVKQLGGEKNRKKSKDWNTDIIKGFVQCLVAIPTVFALYYLATNLFGQLSFTNSTFLNIP